MNNVHIAAARQRLLRKLRGGALHPAFVKLRLLWWKSRPLLWSRISSRGNRLIKRPAMRTNPAWRRVLVYCPEALVREHFLALQIIARPLARAGHEVLLTHCHGVFGRCVPKDGLRGDAPAAQGEHICGSCIHTRFDLVQPDLDGFSLGEAITPALRRRARAMVESLPDTALAGFELDGVKLGLACWHELVLGRKLTLDTPLGPEHHLYLRQYLQTVIATYLGMEDFLPRAGFTDVLLYGQYAANIAVICAAQKVGVNWRLIANINHLGVDRRRAYVHRAQSHLWVSRLIGDWPAWRDLTLAEDEIEETGDDVLVRFGAKSYNTYSPAKSRDNDIFSTLGLDPTRRLVVAFTSSLDEYHAEEIIDGVLGFPESTTPERPYPDQITWLQSISREIAKRSDLQLVIRIHPREDANKREGARSRHLELLRQHLADLPPHVSVVWPSDPVSSYDLLEVADLVQVWSSTVGLESARLGIPVIKIFRGYASYPEGDFALSALTHQGIVTAMEETLAWMPDLNRLIKAWRFYGYSRFAASIDLRDVVPELLFSELPAYREPRRMRELARAVFDEASLWAVNRESSDFIETRLPQAKEATAVKRQLRRIVHAIFTGDPPPVDVPLHFEGSSTVGKRAHDGAFAAKGFQCTYAWGGKIYTRYSPMCARLARLAAHDEIPAVTLA